MDRKVHYIIALGLTLAGLWLALSGVYKPLILALGVASIGLVLWLAWRMEIIGAEHDPVGFSWRLPVYWGWLVGQIVVANIDVARCVLQPQRLQPQTVRVPEPALTPLGVVTYANSITLTPGTATLDRVPGGLIVHALHDGSAAGVLSGDMAARVQWLESGARANAEQAR